ncbi:hypothetical protein ACCD06_15665 [Azospirillum sp. CT11-132]|uniref:hypothetical protein n=1 Tax=Azospirillum sp. CT11-132 TaxID=3396317 RepID=UPI0039A46571
MENTNSPRPALPVAFEDIPAPFASNICPTADRYRRELERTDALDEHSRLIPAADCERIIAEVRESLSGCIEKPLAARLAGHLVAIYPNGRPPEPEVYISGLVRMFEGFPRNLCRLAHDFCVKHFRFLPSPAELNSVLEALKAKRSAAADRARRHIDEHQRRAEETNKAEGRGGYAGLSPERQRLFDEYMAAVRQGESPPNPFD